MEKPNWQRDFPTEPGSRWWFYYRWSNRTAMRLTTLQVQYVGQPGQGSLMYVADGGFVYPRDVEEAYFLRLEEPPLPF